jgi:mono/diheme cytochrome c family protein
VTRLVAAVLLIAVLSACSEATAPPELGPDLDTGRNVYSTRCAICHGGNGQGGSGPSLAEVLATFGDCADQIEWIGLGSNRYMEEVGPTYGDNDKEITGVMPQFSGALTESEIAQVAAFERQQFGGADEETALADCGL